MPLTMVDPATQDEQMDGPQQNKFLQPKKKANVKARSGNFELVTAVGGHWPLVSRMPIPEVFFDGAEEESRSKGKMREVGCKE